jgi:hypothetical protein
VSDTERNQALFDEMVFQTITRRLNAGDSEQMLDTLGYLIQRERRKSAGNGEVPAQVIA